MNTTWVEVSSSALERNFNAVSEYAKTAVCAVVKSNAYGHGLTEAARIFENAGARWLAVTRFEEARALRASGIQARILILTPPPTTELVEAAISHDCSITISSLDDIERTASASAAAGKPAAIHLKIDTGMGRLGVAPRDAERVASAITSNEHLVLEGVFTHFADAVSPMGSDQLRTFETVRAALGKHAARAIVHASNSAALLSLPTARFDMVRIGTLLYGQNPPGATAPFKLEETFEWKARLVSIRTLEAGATVGYGAEYKAKRTELVGTLSIGWGDGFTAEPHARTPSIGGAAAALAKATINRRSVFFGEHEAKVIGRVGMQTVTVSLEDIPEAAVGDVATIPARRLLVSPMIERIYIR
ncbi:MAG: alanine racemase [Actinomycetota bacterium]